MGIVSRLRDAGAQFIARRLPGESVSLSAEIPGSAGPLWRVRVDIDTSPQADGKLLRLRARSQLSLRRAAVAAPEPQTAPALPARIGRWLERRLQSGALRPLTEPFLDRDVSTWLDVRASDATLDEGSRALVPEPLAQLGVTPRPDRPVQSWAGELRHPRPGFGVLSLLQLDRRQLPGWLRRRLGDRPFQLVATLATAIEESPSTR